MIRTICACDEHRKADESGSKQVARMSVATTRFERVREAVVIPFNSVAHIDMGLRMRITGAHARSAQCNRNSKLTMSQRDQG